MNIRNPVDKIDADELIKNLKFNNTENLILYLRDVWKFYELPGIISERLFAIFDKNNNTYLDIEEFVGGMKTLLSENYEKTSKFIFDFYDFDKDGHITKEDIRIVLSYVPLSINEKRDNNIYHDNNLNLNGMNGFIFNNINFTSAKQNFENYSIPSYRDRVESQEELFQLLEKFFNNCEYIDFKRFLYTIQNIGSEVYFYILMFLLENKPFSKANVLQYQKQISPTTEKLNDPNKDFTYFTQKTNNLLGSKLNLIATPNVVSKLSPSITLLKSPMINNLNIKEMPLDKFDLKINQTEINNNNNFGLLNSINQKEIFMNDNFALTNNNNILLPNSNNCKINYNNLNNNSIDLKRANLSDPLKTNFLNIENNFITNNNIIGPIKGNNNEKNNPILNFGMNKNLAKKRSIPPVHRTDANNLYTKTKSNSIYCDKFNNQINNFPNNNEFSILNQATNNKNGNMETYIRTSSIQDNSKNKNISNRNSNPKKMLNNYQNKNSMKNKIKTERGQYPKTILNAFKPLEQSEKKVDNLRNSCNDIDVKNMSISNEEDSDSEDEKDIIRIKGYLYKLTDINKMKKLWFNLVQKDLYYFKNEIESLHKGMHNLTGVFIKEEKIQMIAGNPYYCFGIVYPKKTRYYFTEKEDDYKLWISSIKKVIGHSDINEIYEIQEKLGNGKFGLVRLGIHKFSGQKVAIKIMSKKEMNNEDLELVKTEIEILKICQHPNIIKLLDVIENVEFIFIIMECCSGNDLFSHLQKRGFKIPETRAAKIIHKLATAIFYIHSYGIVHRDLKPENILMTDNTDDADIRLLDFGLSKIIGPTQLCREPYGTLSYVAPEVLTEKPYSKSVDLWSIGVTTYLLLCTRLPFDDPKSEREIARQTVNDPIPKINNWNKLSNEAKDFIENLLQKDPSKRFTIKQVLEHPWIQNNTKNELPEIRRKSKATKTFSFELYSSSENFSKFN